MSVIQVAFQRVREPKGPSGDDDESFLMVLMRRTVSVAIFPKISRKDRMCRHALIAISIWMRTHVLTFYLLSLHLSVVSHPVSNMAALPPGRFQSPSSDFRNPLLLFLPSTRSPRHTWRPVSSWQFMPVPRAGERTVPPCR